MGLHVGAVGNGKLLEFINHFYNKKLAKKTIENWCEFIMTKFIWQKDNWIVLPEIKKDTLDILQKIDIEVKKLEKLKKEYTWFLDIEKKVFKSELFANWFIEDIVLSIENQDVEKVFSGKHSGGLSDCYQFMRNKNPLSVSEIINLHDSVIPNVAQGIRNCPVGVGRSEKECVYITVRQKYPANKKSLEL